MVPEDVVRIICCRTDTAKSRTGQENRIVFPDDSSSDGLSTTPHPTGSSVL